MSKALLSATPAAAPDNIDTFRIAKITEPGDTGWTTMICQPVAKGNFSDVAIVLPPNDSVKQLWVFGTEAGTKFSPACSFAFALFETLAGAKALAKIHKLWANHNSKEEVGIFDWPKNLDPILGSFFRIDGTPSCYQNEYGCQFINGSIFADKTVAKKDKYNKLVELVESVADLDQTSMQREWDTMMGSTPANRSTPKALA